MKTAYPPLNRLAVLLLVASLGGCAVGAGPAGMTFRESPPASYPEELQGQVVVDSVSGGKSTNPLWTSQIKDIAFENALRASLEAVGLLAESGRYLLTATLVRVDQPLAGFDMTVTTEIAYRLVDGNTGQAVLETTITATHTATVGDAFMGAERLKLANEGSARRNIAELMRQLAELDLDEEISLLD